jgi:pyrroline-5-carboxylate reductase
VNFVISFNFNPKILLHTGDVIENADTIIWAVKPQIFSLALNETKLEMPTERKFHVSVMAGIPLNNFKSQLSSQFKGTTISAARVMPNIAMKVGAGCSGTTCNSCNGLIKLKSDISAIIVLPRFN